MYTDEEKNRQLLKELLERPGNGNCADCGAADPEWASYTLGVFVCQSCSGLHRNIPQISRVKSVVLDPWSTSEVEFMASAGNDAAKAKYEQKVPAFYYRPTHTDCTLLREQWIRARYERNEFECVERQEPYSAGKKTNSRDILDEAFDKAKATERGLYGNGDETTDSSSAENLFCPSGRAPLKYFNKHDAREPKAVMKIHTLNATFQPSKMSNAHGLQITYLKDNSTRNIFVYHEDGKEMVDWFNAFRGARFHYLQVAFPGAHDADLVPKLTRNYIKEGYMEKTGPKQTEGFKKRWFTLDDRRLMYFKDPLAAYARGEVFIGSKENSYTVLPGLPPSTQGNHWQFGITIVTPDRKFLFTCETEEEQKDWITVFQVVVKRPMLPQEYAVEAHFKHKP